MPPRPSRTARRLALAPALAAALAAALVPSLARAQGAAGADTAALPAARRDSVRPAERWYDRVSLRGYAQVRYNRLLENNERLVCTQCDRSLGANHGIFLRRMRITITAQPTDRVRFVLQPDFTAESGEATGIAQVRDAYFEVGLDDVGASRLRFGQTNVPFGFENLVSSARRVAFDRADPLNSAVPTERDLGVFLYWTGRAARARYAALERSPRKGTGDMGVVSLGVYNGQTANRPEQNDNLHVALRVAYPFAIGRQVVEPVVSGYTGRYVVTDAQQSVADPRDQEFADRRLALALVLHPQPFGVQAEWNVGTGPEADPVAGAIVQHRLAGGYVQAMYRLQSRGHTFTPYARAQRYDGGKKFETDARRHRVREVEAGVEWTLTSALELTTAFMAADRTTSDLATPDDRQRGHRARVQLQVEF